MFLAESTIQLVPDGTLLLHLILIGVMVVVLNKTLLKPINQILTERERNILGRMNEAQAMASETEQKLAEYNSALREARAEGYRLLEKERAAAMKEKDEKLRMFREEMSRKVSAEAEATRQQEESVRRELEGQASSISALISSQILRRPNS
jgi:F-type H+-transporting ATPase subunit b